MTGKIAATTSGMALLSATILLAGCGAGNKEISFTSGGMTHTFAEGQGSIPKDFPLPIYPKATTTGSVSAQGGDDAERSRFLMLSSTDPADRVSAFYVDQLKSRGWKVDTRQRTGNLVNLSAAREDMDANVMVSSEGGKTTISLAVSKGSAEGAAPVEDPSKYEPSKVTPPTD